MKRHWIQMMDKVQLCRSGRKGMEKSKQNNLTLGWRNCLLFLCLAREITSYRKFSALWFHSTESESMSINRIPDLPWGWSWGVWPEFGPSHVPVVDYGDSCRSLDNKRPVPFSFSKTEGQAMASSLSARASGCQPALQRASVHDVTWKEPIMQYPDYTEQWCKSTNNSVSQSGNEITLSA